MGKLINRNIRAVAGQMRVQASFLPDTFNEATRTVDVCFATDAPVLMGWWERFYEILSFEDGHVRMARLNSGAPLFDNHRNSGTANQPGVVEKAWVKDGKGYATLRFSDDKSTRDGVEDGPGEKIMKKVKDGIVRCVSIGYSVYGYEEVQAAGTTTDGKAAANSIPTYRAIDWEPYEVSFVSVPADIGAGSRSAGAQDPPAFEVPLFTNQTDQQDTMFKRHLIPGGENEPGGGNPTPAAPTPASPEQRSAPAGPAAQPAAPAAPVEDAGQRASEILKAVRTANLPVAFAEELVNNGKDLSQCRQLIIDKLAAGQEGTATNGGNRGAHNIHLTTDEADKRRAAMENALLHRAAPRLFPNLEANGWQDFRGMSLMEMGTECLVASGATVRGMSKTQRAEAMLNLTRSGGLMSTSDFPIILGNTINRTLRAAYALQTSEWRKLVTVVTAADFREKTSVSLSELGDLEEVTEGGEYKADYLTESAEKYKVAKYGKKVGFTWETMVNDDMNFLSRVTPAIAEMCGRKPADLTFGILNTNPVMADGTPLFHADHGNLIGAGTDITVDNIGLIRELMRGQRGLRGISYLNITPKYLVVGPKREQKALQFMAQSNFQPTTPDGQNVWAGSLQVIVDPRITDKRWYIVADPASIDGIELAFLDGEEVYTSTREMFDRDGWETKVRVVVGAKAMEYRGLAKNPGVA